MCQILVKSVEISPLVQLWNLTWRLTITNQKKNYRLIDSHFVKSKSRTDKLTCFMALNLSVKQNVNRQITVQTRNKGYTLN